MFTDVRKPIPALNQYPAYSSSSICLSLHPVKKCPWHEALMTRKSPAHFSDSKRDELDFMLRQSIMKNLLSRSGPRCSLRFPSYLRSEEHTSELQSRFD